MDSSEKRTSLILLAVITLFTVGLTLKTKIMSAQSLERSQTPTLRDKKANDQRSGEFDLLRNIFVKTAKAENLMTPIINQIDEITSDDGVASDFFGWSVAIDGDTAVIGAPEHDLGSPTTVQVGAAYVFVRNGVNWTQQAKLVASDGTQLDLLGWSVAIQGDTAFVAARGDNQSTGVVYIFQRSGTTWTEIHKLSPNNPPFRGHFGQSMAIDGNTLVIGASRAGSFNPDCGFVSDCGFVYVFTGSGSTWTEQAILTASDAGVSDQLGISVTIDGDTIIAGSNSTQRTRVYVFVRNGSVWTEQAKLTPSDGIGQDDFDQVAIDGDTVVVGSRDHSTNGISGAGAAYVYTRTGTTWTEQQKLSASILSVSDNFGGAVALEGDNLIISVPRHGNDFGIAYLFKKNGGTWTEFRQFHSSNPVADDSLGQSIALDETTLIAGAHLRNIAASLSQKDLHNTSNLAGNDQGATYFFNLLAPTAANATISGKVLSANGRAIPRAVVYLTTQNGESITARTNQFGYFRFADIEVGQTLIFNVFSKRYQFQTQVINFNESISGLTLVADK